MKVKNLGVTLLVSIMSVVSGYNQISAQTNNSPFSKDGVFFGLFTDVNNLISTAVISLLIGMTIALFFWALVRGMFRSQGGKDMAQNKDTILWGIAILFVMVSIWGIIIFLQDAVLGTKYKGRTVELPVIPGASNSPNPSSANRLANGETCTGDSVCASNSCVRLDSGKSICQAPPSIQIGGKAGL